MGSQSNGPQTAGSQNWHKPCRGADPTVPYGGSPRAAAVMFCRGGEDRLAITREYKKALVARYGDWLRKRMASSCWITAAWTYRKQKCCAARFEQLRDDTVSAKTRC